MSTLLTFKEFIDSLPANSAWECLPLAHTTTMQCFEKILTTKQVSTSQCKIFNQKLLYFFYGKPNYRSTKGKTSMTSLLCHPVCILFKNSILSNNKIAHVFPFDSGAYKNNLYSQIIDKEINLTEFDLPQSLCSIGKFLNYFYDDIPGYLEGNTKNIRAPAFPFQVSNCNDLYKATGRLPFDDRSTSIEISVSDNVTISADTVDLIICPSSIRGFMDEAFGDSINIEYYTPKRVSLPQDYYAVIDHIAYRYIKQTYGEI